MNDASRFERGERYSVVRDITTYRGVDPITGLDVLIYEFPGEPTAAAGSITSDHLPPILASNSTAGKGTVVSALPFGAHLVASGEREIDDRFVLQAVGALRDAHTLGLVHGDLSTSRLLYASSHVYLEGYGVPWGGADAQTGEKALHADLQALVRALLQLASDNLSTEVSAALRGAAAKGSYPPMNAPRLHAIVRRLAGGAVKVPAAGFSDLTLPMSPGSVPQQNAAADGSRGQSATSATSSPSAAQRAAGAPPSHAPSTARPTASTGTGGREPSTGTGDREPSTAGRGGPAGARGPTTPRDTPEYDDPEPITLNSDPGLTPPGQHPGGEEPPRHASPRDTSPGFVKALPPGATYRHGNLEDGLRPAPIRVDREEAAAARRRSWRGPALLLLVLLVAGLAAYLTVIWQQGQRGASPLNATVHLVDVRVEPANMPPVKVVVDQSPPGSVMAPGTSLSSASGSVQFDVAGTWVFHGEFQTRRAPQVTVEVPTDATITLSFPPPETGQQ